MTPAQIASLMELNGITLEEVFAAQLRANTLDDPEFDITSWVEAQEEDGGVLDLEAVAAAYEVY